MKKLYTLLALTITFSMNAQLTAVTESGNTGQRLSTSNASNHGDIGSNAVDLSYSSISGLPFGATGDYSTAMGHQTTASGDVLQQWDMPLQQVELVLQLWDKRVASGIILQQLEDGHNSKWKFFYSNGI
jgi:hypothetical protein